MPDDYMLEYMAEDEETRRAIPYDEYFESMEGLTESEKKKRKKFAEDFEDVMAFIFALYITMKQYGYYNRDFIIGKLEEQYSEVVLKYMELDKYLEEYIQRFSRETIDITKRHEDDAYYTSNDRAMFISENESHFAFSHKEFENAIKSGKTKKQWIDIRDSRERETHRQVGGTITPINEPFIVGNSLMMYTKDKESFDADWSEIANCRCVTKYF